MNRNRALRSLQYGMLTYQSERHLNSYEVAKHQTQQSNSWSSTENSGNNAWNVNFNDGNTNNNNKYNSNVVRPVVACGNSNVPSDFVESVWNAFLECKRGKTSSHQYRDYLSIVDEDIPRLASELWNDTYTPSTSTCFLVKYPKWREVFAANFRDRIVHHWLCHYINHLFEARFVEQGNVSYNCRKGYGTDKATESLEEGIRKVIGNYKKKAWMFRGDIVGFFMAIDKDVMWRLMERFIKRQYHGKYKDVVLRVTRIIIYHRPEKNCVFNTDVKLWKNLAQNKSLLRNEANKGMPIGNLTTQLFANFYLSFFDSYVKFIFRRENYHYVRFVDDFVIVCDSKRAITRRKPLLDSFLRDVLHLKMHKNKQYFQPASHGMMFVGSYVKNGRKYLSNRTFARMEERVHGFNRLINSGYQLNTEDCFRISTVMNSYLGFCRRRRTYSRRKRLLNIFCSEFYKYFTIGGHYEKISVKCKYKPLQLCV